MLGPAHAAHPNFFEDRKMIYPLWKKITVVGLTLALAACGSTSGMKRSDDATATSQGEQSKSAQTAAIAADFAKYTRISVMDFKSELAKKSSNQAKQDVADGKAADAGKRFADKIATGLSQSGAFSEVARNDSKPGDLVIQGEVTKYKEGNRAIRLVVGLGGMGSANFDAIVRFVDGDSGKELTQITVDKNTWFFGGLMAAAQDVEDFINSAAEKVAEETIKAKRGTP